MLTAEDVLQFTAPTNGFLCALDENIYDLDFLEFSITNGDTGDLVFQVKKRPGKVVLPAGVDPNVVRKINYAFPESFQDITTVSTKLVFSVGTLPVKNFRMIERHYCGDMLLKSYDFTFPFCIPSSTNTWDATYEVPEFTAEQKAHIISSPNSQNQSDSFYFVDNKLVMHNKAYYSYKPNNTVKLPLIYE